MKKIILVVALSLFVLSCQNKEKEKEVKTPDAVKLKSKDLAEKVYRISGSLSPNCEAVSTGCDCCEGRIVFLKNGNFISDFYCLPEKSYNRGKYSVKKSKIRLKYNAKAAIHKPLDKNSPDGRYVTVADTISGGIVFLDISMCGDKMVFKSEFDESYFTEDKSTTFRQAINTYKKAKVWKLLGVKE